MIEQVVHRLGNFEITRRIGVGGMGEVWAGVHTTSGQPVAVKFVSRHGSQRDSYRETFHREVQAMASLDHPGIIRIFDYGDTEASPEATHPWQSGHSWLAMELAPGGSLEEASSVADWPQLKRIPPEIATLAVDMGSSGVQQRPVAVFAAGATDEDVTGCGAALQGSAIYVIDLQTGSLLRRFVTYYDGPIERTFAQSADAAFESRFGRVQLTGSPALYDASTGSLASRGFVGDSIGRLFRMSFQDPDPANWKVDLFFDPYASTDLQSKANSVVGGGGDANFGPAAFKPSISRGPNRQLVVTYGLGETSDSPSPSLAQAVITVAETNDASIKELRWYTVLEKGEKLMGEPLVFNSVTYFPTYWVPNADLCLPGRARVWGVDYFDADVTNPVGTFDRNDADFDPTFVDLSPGGGATPALWFSPKEATVIRGLTLTLGPVCSVRDLNGDGELSTSAGTEGLDTQPQLIAQTSAPAGDMNTRLKGDTSADAIGRLTKNVKRPRSMTIPLSWSVIQ